ncbi:hypothetical protein Agabi119p4_1643 [Agaricus bisporus var. burnettii]|uniref:PH domain-containing protein n=1 Tax=Agaricus bisporus var. burnettii TaxID=192524 RepID=A0A8H7KJE4_AGABI|nr:hypothetical protein Agabi119p4_1643 [Agaricus bisporus var. burnettii]
MCTPPPTKDNLKRARSPQDHDRWETSIVVGRDGVQDTGSKKVKSRSPLRQSIRSLLSALKKGTTKSGDAVASARRVSKSDMITTDLIGPPLVPEKALENKLNETLQHPGIATANTVANDPGKVERSGPMWHLASTQLLGDPQSLVAWISCTGVLNSRKLILTWPNHPTTHPNIVEIDLGRCIDVRPLANAELEKEERAMLSKLDETREPRVFEIVLQGRESEKFAVRNLGERAAWISALWDSILPTEQSTVGVSNSQQVRMQNVDSNIPLGMAQLVNRAEDSIPPRAIEKDAFWSATKREQSLPPLPPKSHKSLPPLSIPPNSLVSQVDVMPRIDSAGTPSPSIYSLVSLPSPTRASGLPISPSIANLGRRSMVKTRLAEIQKERGQETPTSLNTQIDRMMLPTSPASTTGTGRSGFLSVLTSDDPNDAIVRERAPFGHLRESEFFRDLQLNDAGSESRGQTAGARPPLEHSDSICSDLPYVNGEAEPSTKNGQHLASRLEETVKPLSADITTIKNVLGGESGQPTLHQMLESIDGRSRSTKRTVEELVRKFESLPSPSREPRRKSEGDDKLETCERTREMLEATRSELAGKMDTLMGQLTKVKSAGLAIPPQSPPFASIHQQAGPTKISATDMDTFKNTMIDALSAQLMPLRERIATSGSISYPLVAEEASMHLLMKGMELTFWLYPVQHADSVRYLNELNSWLENFVRHGTSQIKGMATNVEYLCKNLGPNHGSILNDIYAALSELRNRDDAFTFQNSVEKIVEAINQSPQNQTNVQALAQFMECQRQEQENFLRAFTAQVSGEIKGERLRFVEAMKEATAINVQAQVDQFKKELAREVATVAQELGRLESDKRAVETKIAHLHAFHANQKQTIGAHAPLTVTAARQTYRPLSQQAQFQTHGGYPRRPLPYPR